MSLLSVHMGLDRSCQSRTADTEEQEELMATGGHTFSLVRLSAVASALSHGSSK